MNMISVDVLKMFLYITVYQSVIIMNKISVDVLKMFLSVHITVYQSILIMNMIFDDVPIMFLFVYNSFQNGICQPHSNLQFTNLVTNRDIPKQTGDTPGSLYLI